MKSIKIQYWSALEYFQEYIKRKKFIRDNQGNMYACNLCGWSGSLYIMGQNIITKICPKCDSKPRQRILKAVLEKEHIVNSKSRISHVSPQGEQDIVKWMRSKASNYLSIDIDPGKAMKIMDLTSLNIKDNTVDIVVCCHVLEHIEADTLAIKEVYRVLKDGGIAIFKFRYTERKQPLYHPTPIMKLHTLFGKKLPAAYSYKT